MARPQAKVKIDDDEVVLNVVESENWTMQRPGDGGGPATAVSEVVSERGNALLEVKRGTPQAKRGSDDDDAGGSGCTGGGGGLLRADGTRAVRFSCTSTVISGDDTAVAEIRIMETEAEATSGMAAAADSGGSYSGGGGGGLLGPGSSGGGAISPRRVSICAGQDPIGYGMSSFLSTRDSLTIASRRSSCRPRHPHADPEAEMRARLTGLIQEILNGRLDSVKLTHLDNFAQKLMHADESEVIGKHVISADENIEIIGKPHRSSEDLSIDGAAGSVTVPVPRAIGGGAAAPDDGTATGSLEQPSPPGGSSSGGRPGTGRERGTRPDQDRRPAGGSGGSGALKHGSGSGASGGGASGGGGGHHRHGSVKFSEDMDATELIACLRKLMSLVVYSPGGGSFVEAIEQVVVDVRTGNDDGYAYDAMILGICIMQAHQELLAARGQRGTFWKHTSADTGSTRFERAARSLVLATFQDVTGGLSTGAYTMEDLVRITTLVSTCDHISRSPASYRLAESAAAELADGGTGMAAATATPALTEIEQRMDDETCRTLESILRCLEGGRVTVKDLLEPASMALRLQSELANGPGGVAAGVRTQPSVVVSRLSGPAVAFDDWPAIAGGGRGIGSGFTSPSRRSAASSAAATSSAAGTIASSIDLSDFVEELRRIRIAAATADPAVADEFIFQSTNLIRFALVEVGSRLNGRGGGGCTDLSDLYAAIMCSVACGLYGQIKDGYKSNLDYKVLDRLAAQGAVEALHVAFRKLDDGWIAAGDVLNLMYYVARWQLTSRRRRRGGQDGTPDDDAYDCTPSERGGGGHRGYGGHRGGGSGSSYLPPTRALMEFLARAMEAMKTGCASAEELRNLARFVLSIYRGYLAGADGRSPPLANDISAAATSSMRNGAGFGGTSSSSSYQASTLHVVRQQIEKALHLLSKDSVNAEDLLEHCAVIVRVMEGPLLLQLASDQTSASPSAGLSDDSVGTLEARIARLRLAGGPASTAATSRYAFMITILERTADDVRYNRRINFAYDAGLLCLCSFIAYEWATGGTASGGATYESQAAAAAAATALCGHSSSELDSLACAAIRETLRITLDKIRCGSAPLADLSRISGAIAATDNLRGACEAGQPSAARAAAAAVAAAARRATGGQEPSPPTGSAAVATRPPGMTLPHSVWDVVDRVVQPPSPAQQQTPDSGADILDVLDGMRKSAPSSNANDLLQALLYSVAVDLTAEAAGGSGTASRRHDPDFASPGQPGDDYDGIRRHHAGGIGAEAAAALSHFGGGGLRGREQRLPPLRLSDSLGSDGGSGTRDSEAAPYGRGGGGGGGPMQSTTSPSAAAAAGRLVAIANECEEAASSTPAVHNLLTKLGGTLKELGESLASPHEEGSRRAAGSANVGQQYSSPGRLYRTETSPRKAPTPATASGRSPRTNAADAGTHTDEGQQTETAVACQTTSARGILTELMAKAALEKIRNNIAEGKFTQDQLKALTDILGKLTDFQDLVDSAENKAYMQKIFNGMLIALQMLTREPEMADRLLDLLRNLGGTAVAGGASGSSQLNRQMTYTEAYDLVIEGLRQYAYTVEQVKRLQNATEGRLVNLHPVIGRRPLNMSEEFLDEHLSAISIKPDGCKRYSYRSLIAPNIELLAGGAAGAARAGGPTATTMDMHERLSSMSLANLANLKMSPLSDQERHARRSSVIEQRRRSITEDGIAPSLVQPRTSILEEDEGDVAAARDAIKAAAAAAMSQQQQKSPSPSPPTPVRSPRGGQAAAGADLDDDDGEIHAHVIATVDFDETAAAPGLVTSMAPPSPTPAASTPSPNYDDIDGTNANNCNNCHKLRQRRHRRGSSERQRRRSARVVCGNGCCGRVVVVGLPPLAPASFGAVKCGDGAGGLDEAFSVVDAPRAVGCQCKRGRNTSAPPANVAEQIHSGAWRDSLRGEAEAPNELAPGGRCPSAPLPLVTEAVTLGEDPTRDCGRRDRTSASPSLQLPPLTRLASLTRLPGNAL